MADDVSARERRHLVNLTSSPLALRFFDQALMQSSHVNFLRDGRIVFHVKYLPMRGGFVLNDMAGEHWGEERFFDCLRMPGASGLTVRVALTEGGLTVEAPGAGTSELGHRFDLQGDLTVIVPGAVRLELPPTHPPFDEGHDQPLQIVRLESAETAGVQLGCDAVVVSGGAFFIEGWVDDRRSRLAGVQLVDYATGEKARLSMGRILRPDVNAHLGVSPPGEFGFWAVGLGAPQDLSEGTISLVFRDGSGVPLHPQRVIRQDLQDFFALVLASFGRRAVIGNLAARSFADLGAGYGAFLHKLYKQVAAQRRVTIEAAFGPVERQPIVSLVCVLYGIADFLYLLVAQFARFGALDGIEFVFVSNSPELEEVLLRDAELASFVFGASVRFLGLNANTGFSHANNVGVAKARAATVGIVNPDVYPRDQAAVARLIALATEPLGDAIVGGRLYYADGSVMHEGMYFDRDAKLSALCEAGVWTVEHYRKGFPDTGDRHVREVPAVTGALMIVEKAFFERLDGFDTTFIYGHYEDADLCLRAREAGGRVILDPQLAFWHYEGMGSLKRPEHLGSALYNRWRFANLWGDRLTDAAP